MEPCELGHGNLVNFSLPVPNREGYWTSKDMVRRLQEDAIKLFEYLHPGCQTLFLFDQSSNHNTYPRNAKVTTKFNLNDRVMKEGEELVIIPGYYMRNGVQVAHHFYNRIAETVRQKNGKRKEVVVTWTEKGVRHILEEHGLGRWEEFKAKNKHWKAGCGGDPTEDNAHMFAAQPDFANQKTAQNEAVIKADHLFALYPKYHCETNWIERYWSAAKRIARKECNYSYAALSDDLDQFLDNVSRPTLLQFKFVDITNDVGDILRLTAI